jgi:transcriptional regulator with XRE-family HTH domain
MSKFIVASFLSVWYKDLMETLGTAGRPTRDRIGALLVGLGPAIRRVRRERSLTLEELAGEVGTSVAHLSRLESGTRQPSLDGLLRIAAALGVEVGKLLDAPEEPGPGTVVRGATSPVYEGGGLRFQPLVPEAGPEGLTAVKVIFPVDRSDPDYREHEGEEWIYVLSGRLRLTLGRESTVLEAGDAAYFNGLLPHRWDVLGEEDVEMLIVGCRADVDSGLPRRLHPLTEGHHHHFDVPRAHGRDSWGRSKRA